MKDKDKDEPQCETPVLNILQGGKVTAPEIEEIKKVAPILAQWLKVMYDELVKVGFTPDQALKLAIAEIQASRK